MNANLAAISALLRSRKLRIDPHLVGECRRWFENPGVRRWYYSPDGMTIDECSEAIGELAGVYGSSRMSERECCDLLESLFVDARYASRQARSGDYDRNAAHALDVRRKTRLRLYECAACNKKLRVADDNLTAEHVHVDPDTLAESRAPFVLKTPVYQPVAPF